METTFKPTAVQHLYRREPIGVYYARLYAGGRNKWVSLKTKSFQVAKFELLKHLKAHYVVAEAEARTQHGKATGGDLASEKVKVTQKKLELPSGDQFRQIVALIRDAGSAVSDGCGDLVEFLAYSGARATEAAGVRWRDVDFERGRIYIAPGKTGQSRYIPLLDSMRDLLDRIRATPRWFRAEHRRKDGYILSVIECEKALTSACTKAGAYRMTRHDLRHLFATRCIESGVDIPTVSRWLGHKDGGALAMRVYGHLRDDHSQAMAAKVTF